MNKENDPHQCLLGYLSSHDTHVAAPPHSTPTSVSHKTTPQLVRVIIQLMPFPQRGDIT